MLTKIAAYDVEEKIISHFAEWSYKGTPFLRNGNTEVFVRDILKLDPQFISGLIAQNEIQDKRIKQILELQSKKTKSRRFPEPPNKSYRNLDPNRKRIPIGPLIDPVVKDALVARAKREGVSINRLIEKLLAACLVASGDLPSDYMPPVETRGKYNRGANNG